VFVLCPGAEVLADDQKDDKIDAKKLIGKWEPKQKSDGPTLVTEFTKDGKVIYILTEGKKQLEKIERTYKIDGNKIIMTVKDGERERNWTAIVSKLTDSELVVAEEKGKEVTLVRIKDK
jgi:uncharacterized protein (TIGR03066 family)